MNSDFLEIELGQSSFKTRSFRMIDAKPINYLKCLFVLFQYRCPTQQSKSLSAIKNTVHIFAFEIFIYCIFSGVSHGSPRLTFFFSMGKLFFLSLNAMLMYIP